MSDRPWLQDGDPSLRLERTLLKRLNAQQPPAGRADQGWATLSAALTGAKAAATKSAATSSASTSPLAAKIAVGVVVCGAAIWGGSRLLQGDASQSVVRARPSAASSASAPIAASEPPPAPAAPEPAASALEAPEKSRAPAARHPAMSSLGEEGRLVSRAHRLIQSGQGAEALNVLRLLESRYPRSVLSQEREVLTIEALGATGDSATARARAKRFMQRHPKSPHAVRLQRFVE